MEKKQTTKPLHKDLSFWIVAATLVCAANIAQFYFGIPWLRQRLADSRPAPRTDFIAQTQNAPIHTATNAVKKAEHE